jgi:hypothetical protein
MTGGTSGSAGSAGSGGSGGGGGGGPVSCDAVAPCGGAVVGTWAAAESCTLTISGMADMRPLGASCVSAPVTGTLNISGTFVAMADGKFTDNTRITGMETVEAPPECLMISGTVTACDRLGLDAIGLLNATCVDNPATQGCTCTATLDQAGGLGIISNAPSLDGNYSTNGNTFVATYQGVDTEYDYCVAGTTLTLDPKAVRIAGETMNPIVLQKQ